eukprot:TRINITY_DN17159_c0_g1_i1.p1 TRINITY_DN17159_c0_g1~~TRINITY_DN17159_c0_g1_i1.p1  ORF type:complete len:188 (+),score=63.09 TRINITY_DN17159_c0_g1_i1:52-564(+)
MPPTASELAAAIEKGDKEAVEQLLLAGASPDAAQSSGTALHAAARAAGGPHAKAAVEIAAKLFAAGANPDIPDLYGQTAAELARESENEELRAVFAQHAAEASAAPAAAAGPSGQVKKQQQQEVTSRFWFLPSKEEIVLWTVSWTIIYFCFTTCVETLHDLTFSPFADDE